MKKNLLIPLFLIFIGAATLAWYLLGDKDKARNVLPSDATAVAVFDPEELVNECGASAMDILRYAVEHREEHSGIDFSQPAYLFLSGKGLSGLSLNVEDEDDMRQTCESYGYASEEQRGYIWVTNNNSIGCIGDGKMLLCGPVSPGEQDGLRSEMVSLMSQDRQEIPMLSQLEELGKAALCVVASLDALPHQYLPEGIDPAATFFHAALRFEGQHVTLSCAMNGKDGAPVETPYSHMIRPVEQPVQFVEDALYCSYLNTQGDNLLPLLRKQPTTRTSLLALNMCVDADMIIRAIDGDVMLNVQDEQQFLLTAKLKNTDFLKNTDDWKTNPVGIFFEKRTPTDFLIRYKDQSYFFGVTNDRLYLASSPELAEKACQPVASLPLCAKAEGMYVHASLDVRNIVSRYAPMAVLFGIPKDICTVACLFESVDVNLDTPSSAQLQLTTTTPISDIISRITGK